LVSLLGKARLHCLRKNSGTGFAPSLRYPRAYWQA
jgi:hypothetical protein